MSIGLRAKLRSLDEAGGGVSCVCSESLYFTLQGSRRLFAGAVMRSEIGRGKGTGMAGRWDRGHVTSAAFLVERGDSRAGNDATRGGRAWMDID